MFETIKRLIKILKEEDIDEIEVRKFFTTIRVSRRMTHQAASSIMPATKEAQGEDFQAASDASMSVEEAKAKVVPVSSESSGQEDTDSSLITIRSPMVGTFYCSRSAESEPFVYEGKEVKVGEVLCIIEAMKLMNEIESETDGVVEKILVEDSQPVEYGQPLFLIKSA